MSEKYMTQKRTVIIGLIASRHMCCCVPLMNRFPARPLIYLQAHSWTFLLPLPLSLSLSLLQKSSTQNHFMFLFRDRKKQVVEIFFFFRV
jgi:hypothetical protein